MCDSRTKSIEINTENIKLDSFLKFIGVVSTGGEAKDIIKNGKISVNETVCTSRGRKIVQGDIVCVNGIDVYEVNNCENA